MNDTLILTYDNNSPDIPTLWVGRMGMVCKSPTDLPVPETTIINSFQGKEAEKIYTLLTQSCGAIFNMDDYLSQKNPTS